MREFWNEEITKQSWNALIELNKRYSFVVIGGWAVYLWTHAYKSKDIDILVDFRELERLRLDFDIKKNERLKKFEVKQEVFDIDIYTTFYSPLFYPSERIIEHAVTVEGFKVPPPEILMILKQQALIERKGIKAKKDAYDIILLILSGADLNMYKSLIVEIGRENLMENLRQTVRELDLKDHNYFNKSFRELSKWKKKFPNL